MGRALARTRRADLTHYNPQGGLTAITVADAAVKRFAQAKDATGLKKAIRAKLEKQAEFVAWWDAQPRDRGGRPPKTNRRSVEGFLHLGRDGLPNEAVVRRWRARLGTEHRLEAAYAQALARYVRILEYDEAVHVAQASGAHEWYTPPEYIAAARLVLGTIDLDPASTPEANQVVRATRIFTKADDGLQQPWAGRVWMNPPYATGLIEPFVHKLVTHLEAGDVPEAVVLVNNATETAWFHELVPVAALVCFLDGRVKFWQAGTTESGAPLQGQALLYLGEDHGAEAMTAFAPLGWIAAPVRHQGGWS
jgi:hypothetical protein